MSGVRDAIAEIPIRALLQPFFRVALAMRAEEARLLDSESHFIRRATEAAFRMLSSAVLSRVKRSRVDLPVIFEISARPLP